MFEESPPVSEESPPALVDGSSVDPPGFEEPSTVFVELHATKRTRSRCLISPRMLSIGSEREPFQTR